MKKIIIFKLILIISGAIISCDESFLEKQPVGVVGESILATSEGVNDLLVGAYTMLNPVFAFGFFTSPLGTIDEVIGGGEAYKGSDPLDQAMLLEFSQQGVTTGNTRLGNIWDWGFTGIDRCNTTLKVLKQVTDMSKDDKTRIEAEARFLRGYYYFILKKDFGNIPFIDETASDYRVPNTVDNGDSTYVNIWPDIAADFDFARQHLPATQEDLGRPNLWAADCFYAKILIYRANEGEYPNGYAEALSILTNAINNGITSAGDAYDLLVNYHDNFDPTRENGPEFIWGVQTSVNDGTPGGLGGSTNALRQARYWCSQSASGPGYGMGWGFYQPTSWYVNHFRTDPNGLPYLDMFDAYNYEIKDDFGEEAAPVPPAPDPFVPDTCGLDPRLDWTVGRRGIPFLDWGRMPGKSWIRNQDHGGPYFMKKYHISQDQWDSHTGSGNCYPDINIPCMRFADVLLLAAECEARVGSLDHARDLVNRVRRRMIENSTSPTNWVKIEDGVTDAANYRIGEYPDNESALDPFTSRATALDAILYERTLELGFEGHRRSDVIRFGKGDEELNGFLDYESVRFDYMAEGSYTDVPDAIFPIPSEAIDLSQKEGKNTLTQNPGY